MTALTLKLPYVEDHALTILAYIFQEDLFLTKEETNIVDSDEKSLIFEPRGSINEKDKVESNVSNT